MLWLRGHWTIALGAHRKSIRVRYLYARSNPHRDPLYAAQDSAVARQYPGNYAI
jgi:hypothetical protein